MVHSWGWFITDSLLKDSSMNASRLAIFFLNHLKKEGSEGVYWKSWPSGSVSGLFKVRNLSNLLYYSPWCSWGLDHLLAVWSISILRTETIQLGPSLTRLHQIKMRTLLVLLLFCHVSSPGKIIFYNFKLSKLHSSLDFFTPSLVSLSLSVQKQKLYFGYANAKSCGPSPPRTKKDLPLIAI